MRHFERKNSKNVSIFVVRRGFEREIGNFESAERGTANDFINLLFPMFQNVNIFPLRATRTMVSPSGDGTP